MPGPLTSAVPTEDGVVSIEGHDSLAPPDGVFDHDGDLPDDLDLFGSFSEWADEIDDADFADL